MPPRCQPEVRRQVLQLAGAGSTPISPKASGAAGVRRTHLSLARDSFGRWRMVAIRLRDHQGDKSSDAGCRRLLSYP